MCYFYGLLLWVIAMLIGMNGLLLVALSWVMSIGSANENGLFCFWGFYAKNELKTVFNIDQKIESDSF